jgi:phosphoribosylanthranilate isomerase
MSELSVLKVKICGTTSPEDAVMAQEAGVDFIGLLVDVPFSSRSVSMGGAVRIASAVDIPIVTVIYGMTVSDIMELDRTLRPHAIQLMDDSPPGRVLLLSKLIKAEIWKSFFLPPGNVMNVERYEKTVEKMSKIMINYVKSGVKVILIDTAIPDKRGGTGRRHDWRIASELIRRAGVPVFLSGGIRPENVAEAVCLVNPYGVDLCSGVECKPGKRDPMKLKKLMDEVNRLTGGIVSP